MSNKWVTSSARDAGRLRPALLMAAFGALVLGFGVFAFLTPNRGDVSLSTNGTADQGSNGDAPQFDEGPDTEGAGNSAGTLRIPAGEDGQGSLIGQFGASSESESASPADADGGDVDPPDSTTTTSGDVGNRSTQAEGRTDQSTTTSKRTTTTTRRTTTTARRTTTTARRTTTTARRTTTTARRTTTTTRRTTTTAGPTTTTPPVSGRVVWVDSRASGGGNGTQAAPFRTIIDGILAVRAGETLMVKGGEYREHVNPGYRMPKGTAGSRITMRNAPGERVVIRGRVILTDIEHWTISGINVTWDNERNGRSVEHLMILNGGTDWEFRDAEVWGAKAFSAILVTKGPRNFALRNLHVHDTYPTNNTNQDHLIYCACGTGGGVIERNLLVGSANGRAIKVGSSSNSGGPIGNVVIRYNTMVDNRGPSNIQLSYNTSNITIERNIMVTTKDYAHNISTFQLNGSNSRATNNIGFDSPGVLERHGGIIDGGGNIHRNPQLNSEYVPQDGQSKAYGHKAP